MLKPAVPQGMRDFTASTVNKRNFILDTIRNVFRLYGFEPLETPAMENLETLSGKYGDEGDKLIFKVLNNGLNDPKNKSKAEAGFEKLMEGKNTPELTERALKYDLTIPFARFVAMNHGQLVFPFKRYQMQPVWRADRPQKGRYREFIQCDADVVGSTSLMNEIELAGIYHQSFLKLGLVNYSLLINNRKILSGLAEMCGGADKLIPITVAIDKLDKIGIDKVKSELESKGLNEGQINTVQEYLDISGNNSERAEKLSRLFESSPMAREGISEIRFILENCSDVNIIFDQSLARGLNYYTGCIFEVKAPPEVKMGSIGGGGRYDDLTGLFGVPGIPGVGISFGVDRIYDVMDEMQLFPQDLAISSTALFFNMGKEESLFALEQAKELRTAGISCEVFHEQVKLDKQFKYAEKKNIPYAVIIGSNEKQSETALIKHLATGHQDIVAINALVNYFASKQVTKTNF